MPHLPFLLFLTPSYDLTSSCALGSCCAAAGRPRNASRVAACIWSHISTFLRASSVNGANGVGRYSTKALAPPNTTGPVNTFEPVYRVEGNALYLKLFE